MYAEQMDVVSTPPAGVEFRCNRAKLIGVLALNMLLTVVTLGIYRFWARTRVRRMLWSSVSIGGDSVEYTGRGMELFVGFLLAMVALTPLLIVTQLVVTLLIPAAPVLGMTLYAGLLILMLGLVLAGFYYARRYLLTRTRWRGISGGQDGSVLGFVWLHCWTGIVSALTLYIATPWRDAKLYRYHMGITRFGTGRFDADARSGPLWGAWMLALVLGIASYGVLAFGFWPLIAYSAALEAAQQSGGPMPDEPAMPGLVFGIVLVATMIGSGIAYYNYLLVRFRHFTNATRLGETRFRCDLPLGSMLGVVVGFVLLSLLALAAAGGIGFLVGSTLPPQIGIPLGMTTGFLCLLAFSSFLTVGWFYVEVMRRICRHMEVDNIGAVDMIMNRADTGPRRGEGLADALGDVGFV